MATPLVLLLLATFGALDTAYLSFSHLFGSDACAAGSGCGEVTASPHSSAFGIPLSVYGLGLYLAIWVTAWRGLREDERGDAIRVVSLLAVLGNLPTLYLLYLQAFVIRAWCPFCLLSAAVILAIFIVAWCASDRQGPGTIGMGSGVASRLGSACDGTRTSGPALPVGGVQSQPDGCAHTSLPQMKS